MREAIPELSQVTDTTEDEHQPVRCGGDSNRMIPCLFLRPPQKNRGWIFHLVAGNSMGLTP